MTYLERIYRIEQQETKDKNKCLELFNSLFETIKYEVPSDNRADLYVTATTKSNKTGIYAVEIKQRNCNLLDFADTIIQVDKYNYLKSLTGYTALYFVIFNDCVAVYNLDKVNKKSLVKRMQMMNKITIQSADKDYKLVYGLTPNFAKIFIIDNDNNNANNK